METSKISQLRAMPVKTVNAFLKSRDAAACGILPEMAEYILQVNEAANLLRDYPNIGDAAAQLQKLYPHISLHCARDRISDALNYFNANCTITSDAWNLYYADVMMDLYTKAIKAGDLKEARLCLDKAREYRCEAASHNIDPALIRFKEQLISPDVELERMGVQKDSMAEAYRKAIEIIETRELSGADKERLKKELESELGIEDAVVYED